jgi:RNA polymerase sigma factor (sigma-70 family)
MLQLVEQGLESLTPQPRQVFRLSRIDGLSLDEIAAHLGISRNTVKSHLMVALMYLKKERINWSVLSNIKPAMNKGV